LSNFQNVFVLQNQLYRTVKAGILKTASLPRADKVPENVLLRKAFLIVKNEMTPKRTLFFLNLPLSLTNNYAFFCQTQKF